MTAQDIRDYEAKYGPIPDGAFVALRTDWYKNWPDMDALSGIAEDGSENFPGWSMEALKYIYEERNAAANGHETLDTDASAEAAKAEDLACERYVLAKGKLQIEVCCMAQDRRRDRPSRKSLGDHGVKCRTGQNTDFSLKVKSQRGELLWLFSC